MENNAPVSARAKLVAWAGPVFFIVLIVGFVFLPFPLLDKLHGVCFGI